jgi:hypothetical protein
MTFDYKSIVDEVHSRQFHRNNFKDDALDIFKNHPERKLFNIGKHVYDSPRSIFPDALGSFNITSTQGDSFFLVRVNLFSRFIVLRPLQLQLLKNL